MEFTMEQKLSRWEELREIKNLMGRLSADYVLRKEKDMFDTYWSRRDDVCLGVNDGWFTGAENVAAYYKNRGERVAFESRMIQAAFPEELGAKTEEEVYGVGMMDYKPVDTAVIEIAGDGQTAKGIWCLRGSNSIITTGGPQAFWEWGWFAVDFVLEGEDWKIWHMQYLQDVLRPSGGKWTGEPKKYRPRPEWAEAESFRLLEPNVKTPLRALYTADRPFAPSPRLPEPFETFADTFSYGI